MRVVAADQRRQRPGSKRPRGAGPGGRPRRDGPTRRDQPTRSSGRPRGGKPGRPEPRPSSEPIGPEIPDDVTSAQLSGFVRRQLKSLPDRVAELVGRHLVMAGRLVDSDPERAYEHARAARTLATRVGVVREACGETAYASGRYAEALQELRAARRITGSTDYLPMMADCERALNRPERAIRLSQDPAVEQLDAAGRAEMTIVAAGARRDMGQLPAALQMLESATRGGRVREPWVARLRYAYADALEAANRPEEAMEWFHRTVAVDDQTATDAAERAAALESRA